MNSYNDDKLHASNVSEFANVEESYSILYNAFETSFENPEEFFLTQHEDYFSLIREKINFVRNMKNLDAEEKAQINQVENDLFNLLEEKFNKILNTNISDYPTSEKKSLIEALYDVFFNNRRMYLKNFILNYILLNKKSLANQYKNQTKKDITLNQIKNEVELKNTNLYSILYSYNDIAVNLLSSEVISIFDFIEIIDIDLHKQQMLEKVFENSNGVEEFNKIVSGFVNSNYFSEFLVELRHDLIETFSSF